MIRLLFVAVIVASGSVAFAHEGAECKCRQNDEALSFREQVLNDFHPLTRTVMDTLAQADEWEKCRQPDRQLTPGMGIRITVPPMGPMPIKLDFDMPELKAPASNDAQPLPDHLAVS